MKKSSRKFVLVSVAAFGLSFSAQATTYNGNGGTGFGGPVGAGMLTFTSDGKTLSGTITPGLNTPPTGQLYDELVIYISTGTGGFANTSTLADSGGTSTTGGPGDFLRAAISGYDGTARSTVNFATGFAANFALAISPTQAQYAGLFALTGTGVTTSNFGFLQSANLTPTNAAGPYTFSISLANIGIPANGSFEFATTYLDSHETTAGSLYRSNEAFGNTITDVTTPTNTGNPGLDTVSVGYSTFVVPEPGVPIMLFAGLSVLIGLQYHRYQITK